MEHGTWNDKCLQLKIVSTGYSTPEVGLWAYPLYNRRKMNTKNTVIFDFDGTLADTFTYILLVFKELAEEYDINIEGVDVEAMRSLSVMQLLKYFHIPLYKLPFIVLEGQKRMKRYRTKIKPIKGIPDMLRQLKERGYTLGILTSNSAENVEDFLQRHNMHVFDFLLSQNNLFGKDRSLKALMKKYSIDREEAIYVGDEIRDIEACHKVKLDIIAVGWGFNTPRILKTLNPTFLAETPVNILEILP